MDGIESYSRLWTVYVKQPGDERGHYMRVWRDTAEAAEVAARMAHAGPDSNGTIVWVSAMDSCGRCEQLRTK